MRAAHKQKSPGLSSRAVVAKVLRRSVVAAEPVEAPHQLGRHKLGELGRVEGEAGRHAARRGNKRRRSSVVLRVPIFGLQEQTRDRQPVERIFETAADEPAIIRLRRNAGAGRTAERANARQIEVDLVEAGLREAAVEIGQEARADEVAGAAADGPGARTVSVPTTSVSLFVPLMLPPSQSPNTPMTIGRLQLPSGILN